VYLYGAKNQGHDARCQNIYSVDEYHSLIAQSQSKNKPRVS